MKGKRKTHDGRIPKLEDHQVFVFGANQDGFHGAGAAGYASFGVPGNRWREYDYGAKPTGWAGKWNKKGLLGAQQGTEGKSYALVTVTRAGAKRSIQPQHMIRNIRFMYDAATKHPELEWLVAQSHNKGLNGYTGEEMADMFASAGPIPDNVVFQKEFEELIKIHL